MSKNNYYRGYIFDLDGTIYLGEEAIPGAPKTIAKLREEGCGVIFLSNKPLEPRENYAKKLTKLGILTPTEDVINSSQVMIQYLLKEMPTATVFPIGEKPLWDEFSAAGVSLSENPAEIDVVIASFDRTFEYRKLDIGYQSLRLGARFFATNADRTCPVAGGEIPDAAAVIGALEGCSGRKLELVAGKPSPLMVETVLEGLGLKAEDCLMVGDRLETDMLMGGEAGMATALVLTGVTKREDIPQSSVQPDFILESVVDILNL